MKGSPRRINGEGLELSTPAQTVHTEFDYTINRNKRLRTLETDHWRTLRTDATRLTGSSLTMPSRGHATLTLAVAVDNESRTPEIGPVADRFTTLELTPEDTKTLSVRSMATSSNQPRAELEEIVANVVVSHTDVRSRCDRTRERVRRPVAAKNRLRRHCLSGAFVLDVHSVIGEDVHRSAVSPTP